MRLTDREMENIAESITLSFIGEKARKARKGDLERQIYGAIRDAQADLTRKEMGRGDGSPKIICLCGSTRFVDTFNEWRKKLTLEGNIIVSIELVLPQSEREDPQHNNYKVKLMLDELHLRKIDIADEVMILNVNGYIGNSTRAEIEYSQSKGKPIKYLEALKKGGE